MRRSRPACCTPERLEHIAIMQVFCGTLLADLAVPDVLAKLRRAGGPAERPAEITDAGRFYLEHGHHPDRPNLPRREQRSAHRIDLTLTFLRTKRGEAQRRAQRPSVDLGIPKPRIDTSPTETP
jgi:hypothetical protein